MGWLWFIPTFHMPHPPTTGATSIAGGMPATHLLLTRKEVDFAIGAGARIIDVDIALDWVANDVQ